MVDILFSSNITGASAIERIGLTEATAIFGDINFRGDSDLCSGANFFAVVLPIREVRGHVRNELGVCQCGVLSDLPAEFGLLKQLSHLDLSFNCFSTLPECIMDLPKLTKLLLCHNQLSTLPDTIGRLKSLTFLSVMKNLLQSLPESIRDLTALQILDVSENALQFLPKETGELSACTKLDLSGNHLQTVPDSLANLLSLCELILHSNCLTTVPANLASLPNLSRLDLQNNSLRFVPPEIQDSPFVQLKGNPLNIPEVPKPQDEPETGNFIVTSVGYRVFLPCGMQLCFPPGAISMVTIHCRVLTPDPHLLKLTDHDLVLSQVLELQPHGIEFQQEVEVRMPYTPTRFRRRREVVLWTFDGNSWSDLETVLVTEENFKPRMEIPSSTFISGPSQKDFYQVGTTNVLSLTFLHCISRLN
nr:PREDICTED: p53-induced death domain-containing protein 1-like [Latimeria chalumnae]|eukprot:XP_014339377.1 PREDICTED: p53-induced death domain-containing protein 1-like [Latimeria chalumnae]